MRRHLKIKTLTALLIALCMLLTQTSVFADEGGRTVVTSEPVMDENGVQIGEKTVTVTYDSEGRESAWEIETVLTSSEKDEQGREVSTRKVTDGERSEHPYSGAASVTENEPETTERDFGSKGFEASGSFGDTARSEINGDVMTDVPPEGYVENNGVYVSPDGKTTWRSEPLTDGSGLKVGFKTTVTETETTAESAENIPQDMLDRLDDAEVTDNGDGTKTYKLVSEETFADGTRSRTVKTAVTSDAAKTTTVTRTVTKEYEKRVTKEGSVTLTVGSVVQSEGNGALSLSPIEPDLSIAEGEGTDVGGSEIMYFINPGFVGIFRSLYERLIPENTVPDRLVYAKTTPYYLFGNFASFIYTDGHNFEMQVLSDSDYNLHYAFCADRSVAANPDMVFKMINADDMHYIDGREGAETAIKDIAINGFWCTAQNAGSLEAFSSWVRSLGYEGSLDALTEGVAEAVTQNAIWHYASSGHNGIPVLEADPVWVYNDKFADEHKLTDADIESYPEIYAKLSLASELYRLIITKGDAGELTSGENTELLMTEDLITPVVTVKGSDGESYDADISFVLDLPYDRFCGNVTVTAEYGEGERKTGSVSANAEGKPVCEIKGLSLKNGQSVLIKLEGMQELTRAAYFLVADSGDIGETQTLVTIEEGERTLGLSFELMLEVEDPETESVYREKTESSMSSEATWHYEELTVYEYPAETPPSPPAPEPRTYCLEITEEIYGEAPRTDTFEFTLELSNTESPLPAEFRVEGSRYPNGGVLTFAPCSEEAAGSASTGSGTGTVAASFTLGHEEYIKLFGLPDGTVIRTVQRGGDERYETKIDGALEPSRIADRKIRSEDVHIDYANGYYSSSEPTPEPAPEPEPTPEPEPVPEPTPEPEPEVELGENEIPLEETPNTGDNSSTALWLALSLLSLAGIATILGKKKEN